MTDYIIQAKKLKGDVQIPPSKSMAHRAIIAASLAEGESVIDHVQLSDDIVATLSGMEAFGARIEKHQVDDHYRLRIQGVQSGEKKTHRTIDANESGSTLRFLIPISSLFEGESHFIGRGQLGSRPLDIYEDIYKQQGLSYKQEAGPLLDLRVEGRLKAGDYEIPGDVSSQFITGLLYTLPLLDGDSSIQITKNLESVGYLDLTLQMLDRFGIDIQWDPSQQLLRIPGKQKYQAQDYTVEGDFSQSAFWLGAAALGNPILSKGLDMNSLQGDKAIIPLLNQFGANIVITDQGLTSQAENLQASTTIDGSQVPDIIPMIALVASLSRGRTEIINLSRLRIKECDRLQASHDELNKLGAKLTIKGDDLIVEGVSQLQGGVEVWSHKDHRMAMMLAIASTVCQEAIIIKDTECVAKSYPDFWRDFKRLGGDIHERDLG